MTGDQKTKKNTKKKSDLQMSLSGATTGADPAPVPNITYKKSWMVLCLAILGGAMMQSTSFMSLGFPLVAAAGTPKKRTDETQPWVEAEIPAYPGTTSYSTINTNLKIPECARESSLEACVETVCDQVAIGLSPLNKMRIGEQSYRVEDNEKLNRISARAFGKGMKAVQNVKDRFMSQGLTNLELMNYLQYRSFFLEQSVIPNCAGGAAKTAFILSQQPVVLSQEVTFNLEELQHRTPPNPSHTILKIGSKTSPAVVCDSWNLPKDSIRVSEPVGICRNEDIQKGDNVNCAVYQEQFWTKNLEKSITTKAPEVKKLSHKERLFYLNEVTNQNARFFSLNKTKPTKDKQKKSKPTRAQIII